MATMPLVKTPGELVYRGLVAADDWGCLVRHYVAQHGTTQEEAEVVLNEAVGFVVTCATFRGERLAPSPQVDRGWDLLVLHSRPYRELCEWLGAGFIDHDPMDGVGFVAADRAAEVVAHTVARMRTIGPVNEALWSKDNGTGGGGSGDGGDGKGWQCCVG